MKAPDADAGDEGPEDENSPFAIEIGDGMPTFDGGFALGALRDSEGGTQAMLATVDASGQNGKLVKLARARSDSICRSSPAPARASSSPCSSRTPAAAP